MNPNLFDTYLESMNFLNEISINYPRAISFGSGRPPEDFFNVESALQSIPSFVEAHRPADKSRDEFFNYLGQYNKTKGIINDSIAILLANDEQITANPEDIIVTDGAQEGMAIVINTLFSPPDDFLLVSDPSYVGFVGYAKIAGIPVQPIKRDFDSIDLADLESTAKRLLKQGKRPRALYEVPDFHNPTGNYMPLQRRRELLELAERYDFYIIEDNPYGYFRYDAEKIPTLKALDHQQRVIYLGSFSKSLFPSIRLGYLVVDQKLKVGNRVYGLAEECKKVKSFLTVNTSTLLQAMAGAVLLKENHSLKAFCQAKVEQCKKNRNVLLGALESYFPPDQKWQKPAGGFFMAVDLPFPMTNELLLECVEKYGVIVCPMTMFCIDKSHRTNQIRVAFSNLTAPVIEQGIERLARFIRSKL